MGTARPVAPLLRQGFEDRTTCCSRQKRWRLEDGRCTLLTPVLF